ncbi:MAG: 1-acyl-sn-glycerol-3-phosphate acyltransferase [Firmicutes bacterium]|nr:1-acyl-sn-glycerol-3-phosphate acyltransferase [Bacillota bacterium]
MTDKKEAILYKILRPIITVLFKFLFTPKIIGKEKIPKEGRIVLAGNHTHIFDSLFLISCTKRCIHFLAKKELWIGVKKILFGNMGLIPVDRKNGDPKALESAIEYLNDEKVIGIFPEGTTEKVKGKLLPFKRGAVTMAKETNTKIIPFAIKGDYKLFSKNLTIIFGEELEVIGEIKPEIKRLEGVIDDLLRGDL